MILYKYVDLKTGLDRIISEKTLKFTHPANFNDPLETAAMRYVGDDDPCFPQLVKEIGVSDCYGILCLTRNHSNLLMWSHYATGERFAKEEAIFLDAKSTAHGGLVIGIDVEKAGLNNIDEYVVPARFGNIIYTATMPTHEYQQSNLDLIFTGRVKNYQPSMTEAFQRVFLYKSQEWAYEEEVRVVKNIIHDRSGILSIPEDSIAEVYIGLGQNKPISRKKIIEIIRRNVPMARIFVMNRAPAQWSIRPQEYTNEGI